MALAKYTSNGSLDTSFGNAGRLLTGAAMSLGNAMGLAISSDDQIIAVGASGHNFSFGDFGLGAFLKDTSVGIVHAPTNLNAISSSTNEVHLSWDAAEPANTRFTVEVSIDGANFFAPYGTTIGQRKGVTTAL